MSKKINQANIDRLRAAIAGTIVFDGFDDFECDIRHYDWATGPSSRSWWWNLQQLPFLAWAIGTWPHAEKSLRDQVIHYNTSAVRNWRDRSSDDDDPSRLAWHDHAAALRAYNIYNWVNFLELSGYRSDSYNDLVEIVEDHLQWLLQDTNYTRHTNHGFEQAWIVSEIALAWPKLTLSHKAREIGLRRLRDEVRFGFTEQGVHKENSPGYQWFMLKRLRQVSEKMGHLGIDADTLGIDGILRAGERYLEAVALLDGKLPLIGDTFRKDKQKSDVDHLRHQLGIDSGQLQDEVFDYAESGYVILRRRPHGLYPGFHLVMKSGHYSDYHRHDDDLAVHLSYGETTLLGDSGGYGYDRHALERRYVRSPYAHTSVFPQGTEVGIRKRKRLRKLPNLTWNREKRAAIGQTFQFAGLRLSRRVKYPRSGANYLKITDKATSSVERETQLVSNFVIPHPSNQVDRGFTPGRISISGNGIDMSLRYDLERVGQVVEVIGLGSGIVDTAIVCPSLGVWQPCVRIELHWTAAPNKTTKHTMVIEF